MSTSENILASFAAPFTQRNRIVSLSFSDGCGIAKEALLAQRVVGEEAINAPFCFTVHAYSPNGFIEAKELMGVGAAIEVKLASGDKDISAGIVTQVQRADSNGGMALYILRIEPAFSVLRHHITSRIYQDKTPVDIVKTALREHIERNPVFAKHFQVEDRTTLGYKLRSYCQQRNESTFAFVTRLLAEEGISYYWRYANDNGIPVHSMVLFDRNQSLQLARHERVRFHRADGTECEDSITGWQGTRRVMSGASVISTYDYKPVSTYFGQEETVINQGRHGNKLSSTLEAYEHENLYYAGNEFELRNYALRRQQARDLATKTFTGQGTIRGVRAGQWFELLDHPVHQRDNEENRQFIVMEKQWVVENNLPVETRSDLQLMFPQAHMMQFDEISNAFNANKDEEGQREQPYLTSFKAVRRIVPVVPAYSETEHAKPRVRGPQVAVVVGPRDEEIHTDERGRILVQFPWQRRQEHPKGGADHDERSSTWVRVVTPLAGDEYGHCTIPRVGMEVLVDFIDGDPDRLICIGAVHNGTNRPPTFSGVGTEPANKTLSGFKSKEYKGRGYNELLFDDSSGQLRAKLSSEHGKTQLNQGYLIHPRKEGKGEPRGEGFELRSDKSGALRAAEGILISAWGRLQAAGKQLSREEYLALKDECFELFVQLGKYAAEHEALGIDPGPQEKLKADIRNWENGSNAAPGANGGGRPIVGITAPEGISFASQINIVSYAARNLDSIAQQHLQLTAGQRFNVNAGKGISLFSHQDGFKAIAHQGKMLIQSQHDDTQISASDNIKMTATEGQIVGMANKSVVLITSGGAYLKLDGANVELGCPGSFTVKAASHSLLGGASMSADLPKFAQGDLGRTPQLLRSTDGKSIEGVPFKVRASDGSVFEGKTNAAGKAQAVESDGLNMLDIQFFEPEKQ